MIRLIASDLDGTIINEHNACDPSVAEAIAHYRSCGVRFAVCSGRPIDSLTPLLEGWGSCGPGGLYYWIQRRRSTGNRNRKTAECLYA